MEFLNYGKGVVMLRCWYYENYNSSRQFDSVLIATGSKNIVVSYNDATNLWNQAQASASNYGEPKVIGMNNYLEYSDGNSWNCYAYIDRDSIKFGMNDDPIDLKRFTSVLQKTIYGNNSLRCYYDKSDRIILRFWGEKCQFYLMDTGELYFLPLGDDNYFDSKLMDQYVEASETVRLALRVGRRMRAHADLY